MAYVIIIGLVFAGIFWVLGRLKPGWEANNTPIASRESTKKVLIVFGIILSFVIISGYNTLIGEWDQRQRVAQEEGFRKKEKDKRETLTTEWRTNKVTILKQLRDQQAARDFVKARNDGLKYAFTQDPDLRAILAELEASILDENNRKRADELLTTLKAADEADTGAMIKLYRELAVVSPDPIQYKQKLAVYEKREAAEAAKALREEKARKRKEGVRIGMTKQDVLDSSWGRPDSINKTTTSRSLHEQWVYGSRNYLYFDNGVLTSIQN